MTKEKKGVPVITAFVGVVSNKAGVYRMLDENGIVLYVGKAKNLKKRIINYTHPEKNSLRIQRMIARTHSMECIETESETEALLLEADLIKTLKPYYNILLRDDKSYPEIELSFDKGYPSIKKHRGEHVKGRRYFGPFTSASAVKHALGMLENVFYLSSDYAKDAKRAAYKKRYLPVLKHQFLKNFAPSSVKNSSHGTENTEDFDGYIRAVIAYLEGKDDTLVEALRGKMLSASEALDYEKAGIYRDRLQALNTLQISKSIVEKGMGDSHIMALYHMAGVVCIQVLFYRNSMAAGSKVFFPRCDTDAIDATFYEFITQFYQEHTKVKRLYISHDIDDVAVLEHALGIRIRVPKAGRLKKISQRAMENAQAALERHKSSFANHTKSLQEIMQALSLPDIPNRIEVYDNSHIQGDSPVGAMIVAGQDGFDKKSYRLWNIQTEMQRRDSTGHAGDDYAMMREVFTRRFSAQKKEPLPLPDLIVVDGGKGQLNTVVEVLDSMEKSFIPVVCIAKGEKRNDGMEMFYTRTAQVPIPPATPLHYFLERIRDEAHRFVIAKHRKRRDKKRLENPLDAITGIGKKRRQALLQYFGSARAISGAGVEELCKVEGISKAMAQIIYSHFHG